MYFGTFKNTKSIIIIICLVMIAMITACAEKDEKKKGNEDFGLPPVMAETPNHTFNMPAKDANLSSHTSANIEYHVEPNTTVGYSLDQFITKSVTDELIFLRSQDSALESRDLFSYRMKGNDGWNPWRDRGRNDVSFDFLKSGYYIPVEPVAEGSTPRGRTYSISWYNNSDLRLYCVQRMNGGTIEVFRTIIVEDPQGKEVMFEINMLPVVNATNSSGDTVPGISLKEFITLYITDVPQNYNYVMTALDGPSSTPFTWANMQAGFLILGEDRTFVPGESGSYRLRYLKKISLVGKS